MKAVFLDFATVGPGLDMTELLRLLPTLQLFETTDNKQIGARIEDCEVVLTNKFHLGANEISNAPALRYIGLTATGTNNIDLETACKRGIAVTNIRDYCTQSVVEHVFGTLLTLSHNLNRYNASTRKGEWSEAPNFCLLDFPIRELSTMTMGIVGYGTLGASVARTAEFFGMDVTVSKRPGNDTTVDDTYNGTRVDFEHLLDTADVISLHCPLTDSTRNLFGASQFARMKKSAILINSARGGLVDSEALVNALANGHIAAAAIDVLQQEPPVDGDALLNYAGDNLILTPHIAWASESARQNALDEMAANLRAFLQGERRNRVV